jgi:hypothetical protein
LLVLGGFGFCDGMLLPGIALSNTGLEHLGPRLICGNYRMFSFGVNELANFGVGLVEVSHCAVKIAF